MRQQATISGYNGVGRHNPHLQAAVGSKLHGRYGAARSLDLLRQNIQSLVNRDVDALLKTYLDPAILNIRRNLGDDSLTEHSLRIVCIQMLEEAKAQYYVSKKSKSEPQKDSSLKAYNYMHFPVPEVKTSVSTQRDEGSIAEAHRKEVPTQSTSVTMYRRKDNEVDGGWDRSRKKPVKTVGNLMPASPTPVKIVKVEHIRKDGPKWDPNRITSSTLFIMGARANKVLGFGQNRGRLYTKHPDLMKYSGDTEDKEWLSRSNLMPPTGGIAYLLVLDDIRELAQSEDYRQNPNVLLTELKGFQAPQFMLMKIRMFMAQVRSEEQSVQYFPHFETTQYTSPVSNSQPLPQPQPQSYHCSPPITYVSTQSAHTAHSAIDNLITETANYFTQQPQQQQPDLDASALNPLIDFQSDYF